jgi:hypothetical protein
LIDLAIHTGYIGLAKGPNRPLCSIHRTNPSRDFAAVMAHTAPASVFRILSAFSMN